MVGDASHEAKQREGTMEGEMGSPFNRAEEEAGNGKVLPPRDVPRWPLVVALFNLTGLGIGYLYMRRWLRWLLHFLVTVGLVLTAFATNGASIPVLWVTLIGLWLLWMTLDGWRQARFLTRGASTEWTDRRWVLFVAAVLLLGLEAAGLWGYAALGRRAFAAGMAAYRAADCRTAMQHFNRVTTAYELTLSSNVAQADAWIVECSLLVFADSARSQGEYADAVDGYEAYEHLYPEGELHTYVREAVADTYEDWATRLRRAEKYQAALEKYCIVLDNYAETSTGGQAEGLAAETYVEWSMQLREDGEFAESISTYQVLLDEYPGTSAAADAEQLAAATYVDWAVQLREAGEYEAAVEKHRVVLADYSDVPAAAEAEELVASTYAEWAAQLREAGEYGTAVEKYETILGKYPDTAAAAEAGELVAETYVEWAAQLRDTGEYEAAIENYQEVLEQYPDTPAAAEAETTLARTYVEWAAQLREEGLYAIALLKYETVLSEYPDTEAASDVQGRVEQTYLDWGAYLHSQGKYIEAMEKFTLLKDVTDDADAIAAAEEGYDEALWGLSQDSTGEGQDVMTQALPGVCEGEPADSPAVGLEEEGEGKALFGGSEFDLPADLRATRPGHFRYVVCLEKGTSVVQRCPYTGGHTLVRQRRWWRVRVRDTRTARIVADRTFYGSTPGSCPFSRVFFSTTDYTTGNSPSADQVIGWLQGVVR